MYNTLIIMNENLTVSLTIPRYSKVLFDLEKLTVDYLSRICLNTKFCLS